MEAMDIQAVESKLSDVTVTAIPMSGKNVHKDLSYNGNSHATISTVPASSPSSNGKDKDNGMSKYAQLLAVIEEMGKEVRPSYSGSRSSAERLKREFLCLAACILSPIMSAWDNKWKWNTMYCADSVEWCPIEQYRNVFVCGTYQLDKKDEGNQDGKQTRLGCIYLFVVDEITPNLTPIQTIKTSGILDQKWCYHPLQGTPVLAAVTSEGTIQIYRLVEEDGTLRLKLWTEDSIGQDILALSLDWSTNKLCSHEPHLVVSDSAGNVTLLKLCGDGFHTINVWAAHGFEAWITAFNYWNTNIFYSGGDDCVFKSFDSRVKEAVVTNRSHEAGVTSVRSNIEEEHQLLTGSYDESVRLWDARSLKRCLYESDVGGGVWRLKFHPFQPSYILAACMYGGFRLLRLQEKPTVLGEYMGHDSIAYGADWKFDQNQSIAATCSFYDCSVHLSELHLEEPSVN